MNRRAAFCSSSLAVQRPKTKRKNSLNLTSLLVANLRWIISAHLQTQSAYWSLSCTTLRLWLPLCFFSFGCFSSSPLFRNRLQRADSRPSVREDGAVMFLSADGRMNELPTVSLKLQQPSSSSSSSSALSPPHPSLCQLFPLSYSVFSSLLWLLYKLLSLPEHFIGFTPLSELFLWHISMWKRSSAINHFRGWYQAFEQLMRFNFTASNKILRAGKNANTFH